MNIFHLPTLSQLSPLFICHDLASSSAMTWLSLHLLTSFTTLSLFPITLIVLLSLLNLVMTYNSILVIGNKPFISKFINWIWICLHKQKTSLYVYVSFVKKHSSVKVPCFFVFFSSKYCVCVEVPNCDSVLMFDSSVEVPMFDSVPMFGSSVEVPMFDSVEVPMFDLVPMFDSVEVPMYVRCKWVLITVITSIHLLGDLS